MRNNLPHSRMNRLRKPPPGVFLTENRVCDVQRHGKANTLLTQGGSVYDIAVGTVVNVDIHSMMLFYLHTAGDNRRDRVSCTEADVRGLRQTLINSKQQLRKEDLH